MYRCIHIGLACLVTALSITILALTAHHVSFIRNLQRDQRDIIGVLAPVWNAETGYQDRRLLMWYLPTNLSMIDVHVLLAVGILSTVSGIAAVALNLGLGDVTVHCSLTGRTPSPACPSPSSSSPLASPGYRFTHIGTISFWMPGQLVEEVFMRYSNPIRHWTFETWNRELAPYIRANNDSISAPTLRSLSMQAQAARIMTVPALVLAVVPLIVEFWGWRQRNIVAQSDEEADCDYDCYEKPEVCLEHAESACSSPVSPVADLRPMAERGDGDAYGAKILSTADISEVMGDAGYSELDGDVAAAEKSVGERQ